HGTGTRLGDPIEAQALLATYGQGRAEDRPLLLGSVKSNIGHAQAAAGVAGVIKMVAAMRHGMVPATLHVNAPSPHVDWDAGAVRLVTEATPWPEAGGRPRRAGVSSFGFSGTNAHVIIEQAPDDEATAPDGAGGVVLPVVPWVVSGRSAAGLAGQADRLAEFIEQRPEADVTDVGWSLATSRGALEHRAVVLGGDRDELAAGLRALAVGREVLGVVSGAVDRAGKVGFVFTGQGAQRVGMGQGLYAAFPVFAEAFDAVCAGLAEHVDGSLGAVIRGEGKESWPGGGRIGETVWAQAGLFAVEVALFRLLESWGVGPQVVAGHSIGELAAAHVAGVWSLADACAVVAARGRLMQQLPSGGAMVAVEADEQQVLAVIADRAGVGIAAVNGPRAVVISGVEDEVLAAAEALAQSGARTRRLRVSHAFHSPLMEPMLEEFAQVVGSVDSRTPRLTLVSALTGQLVSAEVTDPSYWVRHVREAVRFADAASALRDHGVRTFIEIGPDGVLSGMGPQTRTGPEDEEATAETWLPVLRRGRDEPRALLTALAKVFVRGVAVDWDKVYAATGAKRIALPTYAFQRQRYWLTSSAGSRAEDLGLQSPGHPLLGAAVELPATGGVVLTGQLGVPTQPWLAQSLVTGRMVVPATALMDMAVRAGDETDCGVVEELAVEAPLVLPERGDVRVQVTVGEAGPAGRREVTVFARAAEGEWVRHASGTLAPAEGDGGVGADTAAWSTQWPPAGAVAADTDGLYEGLAGEGLEYGPVFQGVRAAWRRDDEVFVEIALPEDVNATGFGVHPALLDAALHVAGLEQAGETGAMGELGAAGELGVMNETGPLLPLFWSDVRVHASGATAARVRVAPSLSGEGMSVTLADAAGQPIASVGAVTLGPQAIGALDRTAGSAHEGLFRVEWVPAAAAEGAGDPGRTWAVLGEDGRLGVPGAAVYADVAEMVAAVEAGAAVPDTVATCCVPVPVPVPVPAPTPGLGRGRVEDAAQAAVLRVLGVVREWLDAGVLDGSRLVVVTERGVDTGPGVGVRMDSAGVTGLVRAAAGEHPERIVLADVEALEGSGPLVVAGTALGEPEFAVRDAQVQVRRLARASGDGLPVPDGTDWRLGISERGAVENLVLAEYADGRRPLEGNEVRVAVRAAGVNPRDVRNVLNVPNTQDTQTQNMYPAEPTAALLGLEGTGIVLETGPDVVEPAVGDAVMGLFPGAFGPLAVADARTVTRVPAGWSSAQAAAAPMAFLTAYHALTELAGLRRGERVLIHAAAGGVGMAAVQVARHLGAEVYATASPSKWRALRELGLDDSHLASSRTTEFEEAFRTESGGRGMDVVLNSLTGEPVDASLRLTRPGGRFVELGELGELGESGEFGKADVRDPSQVERDHRAVAYRTCDLPLKVLNDPGAIDGTLSSLSGLFAQGALTPLPVTCWDVRRAVEAFRFLSGAQHIGKVVLTVPALPAHVGREGTVLVTGASGALGGLVARHLASTGRARRVLLASRRGMGASRMSELVADLAGSGTSVQVVACDVADREQLAEVIAGVPSVAPLTGVIHTAGVLDDGVVGTLTPDRVRHVMRPKSDAAWHLHELTRHLDLDTFTLFSSVAGVWGTPGQANYAAGNTFLDALAAHRRHQGLPAVSLAWGPWEQGMAGELTDADRQRMGRQGLRPLATPDGLALLDAAAGQTDPLLVTARLDLPALRRLGSAVPALVTGLVRPGRRTAAAAAGPEVSKSLANQWAALPPEQLDGALLDLVLTQAALVLGRPGPESIESARYFRQLGFDSLTALQFRNRISGAIGLRLPAAVVFDYPTPVELAGYLRERIADLEIDYEPVLGELDKLKVLLSAIAQRGGKKAKIMSRLEVIVEDFRGGGDADGAFIDEDISGATDDEIFDLIEKELDI
ncbi:type I polyketide synthase, partial [Streptomyces sp. NPDC051218]|uniref:type I polyketide synthase n=1 Tax=Streptomyces sp. NPDC051218 TaxID=3365645 RepID=UPI0037872915